MKRFHSIFFLTLFPAALALADHHGDDLSKKLDEILAGISQPDEAERFEPRMAMRDLTSAASAPDSEMRDPYVKLLLERLEDSETSQAAKAWILRQLENVGRAESVPALTKLVGSPIHHLRELARRALEQNPSDEAGAALRRLAEEEQDRSLKRAFVHSLGERGDAEAAPMIGSLLKTKDDGLRKTAILALGKIASDEAVPVLETAYKAGKDQELIADALLESSRRLTEKHPDKARKILEGLYQYDEPARIRAAALGGLLAVNREEAEDLILLALQSEEALVRQRAITAIGDFKGGVLPNVLAVKLPELSDREQTLALAVLGDSGDLTAASQLADTLGSEDLSPERERAVISVLGQLGGIDAAQRLLDLAGRTGDEGVREAARDALSRMPGEGVDAALVAGTQRGDLVCRTEAVRALARRGSRDAMPILYAHVEQGPRMIREASLDALGQLATSEDIPRLVKYLGDADETAMKAVMQACRRAQGSGEVVDAVLAAMKGLDVSGKQRLLPCLGVLGGEKALGKVRNLVNDEALGKAAMKTLMGWSGPEAVPVFLELAGEENIGDSDRTLTLRALSRLLENPENGIDREDRLKHSLEGIRLAKRPEDKRLFFPVLGKLRTPGALEALVAMLEDKEVAEEAAVSALAAVENLRGRRSGRVKQQVLKAIVRADVGKDTVERAQKMLDEL